MTSLDVFRGRIAVVTGGGSGLGAAMSRQFASAGMAVAVLDIDEANAQACAKGTFLRAIPERRNILPKPAVIAVAIAGGAACRAAGLHAAGEIHLARRPATHAKRQGRSRAPPRPRGSAGAHRSPDPRASGAASHTGGHTGSGLTSAPAVVSGFGSSRLSSCAML